MELEANNVKWGDPSWLLVAKHTQYPPVQEDRVSGGFCCGFGEGVGGRALATLSITCGLDCTSALSIDIIRWPVVGLLFFRLGWCTTSSISPRSRTGVPPLVVI